MAESPYFGERPTRADQEIQFGKAPSKRNIGRRDKCKKKCINI